MRTTITLGAILASLAMTTPYAAAQSGQFCLKQANGAASCIYASMAQCNQDKALKGGECTTNPNATTGSGAPSGSRK